jgi:DNA-binding XRE family transcriptional regulator
MYKNRNFHFKERLYRVNMSTHPLEEEKISISRSLEQQLAALVKRHRLAFRLSQAKLARLAATTQSAIANIEAGRANPTLKTIQAIAGVFKLQPQITFRRPQKQ